MADLIDREALLDAMPKNDELLSVDVRRVICDAPAVDDWPVVHSSWGYMLYRSDVRITTSGEVVCRNCHALFFRVIGQWFKYCPNCGAKMDAVEGTERIFSVNGAPCSECIPGAPCARKDAKEES